MSKHVDPQPTPTATSQDVRPRDGRRQGHQRVPEPAGRVPAEHWWVERLAQRLPVVDVLREDRQRNDGLASPGFQALAAHRLARWADGEQAPRWARRPLARVAAAGQWVSRAVYGIELPRQAEVGRRVRIAHQGGIVVHPAAAIGDDVLLRQGVTIGLRGDEEPGAERAPRVEDGAQLGAGAVVVGPVVVGPRATVGANAVVTTDVPAGGRALPPRTTVAD